ncbi:MAG: FHA domain-containing protein [Myxococcota bacterium]|nr:FHA domain-containing protein [Myxococcota bacterium]
MASRQVELVVRRPGQPERRMILGPGVTHLGRAEDNDLVLPDIGVSRRHARIVVEGETFRFEDLGSGNGSFYNGNQVETQALSDGDEVVIEPFTLTFRVQAAVSLMGPSLEDDETLRAPPMDAFAGAPARLVTLAGHRLSSAYPLGGAPVALGRSEARDIVLYDPAASRNHAVVELRAEGFWARDFGSANGTYVNGQRVTEHPLAAGDVLRIGSTEFRFETMGSPSAGAAAPVAPPAPPAMPSMPPIPSAAPTGPQTPVLVPSRTAPTSWSAANPYADEVGDPVPAPRSAGTVGMVVAGVVFLLVVGLAGAGVFGFNHYQRSAAEAARAAAIEAARGAASVPAAPASEAVQSLLNEGRTLFHEGRPLDAASRFYKVLQEDPANADARRLGFVVCEHIAFQQLEHDIIRSGAGPRQRRDIVRNATRQARAALAGRDDLDDARIAVRTALVHSPDATELEQLLVRVRDARVAAASAEDRAEAYAAVAPLHDAARAAVLDGRDGDARAAWQKVVEADAKRLTWYAHEAELWLRVTE